MRARTTLTLTPFPRPHFSLFFHSEPGQFTDTKGSVECQSCSVGFYSWLAAKECIPCNGTQYSKDIRADRCTNLESGRKILCNINISTGINTTRICYNSEACPAGKFAQEMVCTKCPIGWDSVQEKGSCEKCSKGKYRDDADTPSCQECPSGWFNELGFNEGMKKSDCTLCPSGYKTEGDTRTICTVITVDEELPIPTLRVKRVAPADVVVSWNGTLLLEQLEQKHRGTVEYLDILVVQLQLQNNHTITEAAVEFACEDHFGKKSFSNKHIRNFTVPIDVAELHVRDFPTSVAIAKTFLCARAIEPGKRIGKATKMDWKVATDCGESEFLKDTLSESDLRQRFGFIYDLRQEATPTPNPEVWTCQKCPVGCSCKLDVTTSMVGPKFGWYLMADLPLNASATECLEARACLGGPNERLENKYFKPVEGEQGGIHSLTDEERSERDFAQQKLISKDESGCNKDFGFRTNCSRSSSGPNNSSHQCRLCQACKQGYSRSGVSLCLKCPEEKDKGGSRAVVFLAGFAFFLFICALVSLRIWFGNPNRPNAKMFHRKSADSVMKRILITHLQMVTLVSSLKVDWPDGLLGFFDALFVVTAVDHHFASIECDMGEIPWQERRATLFYNTQLFILVMPLIWAAALGVFWTCLAANISALRCHMTRAGCVGRRPRGFCGFSDHLSAHSADADKEDESRKKSSTNVDKILARSPDDSNRTRRVRSLSVVSRRDGSMLRRQQQQQQLQRQWQRQQQQQQRTVGGFFNAPPTLPQSSVRLKRAETAITVRTGTRVNGGSAPEAKVHSNNESYVGLEWDDVMSWNVAGDGKAKVGFKWDEMSGNMPRRGSTKLTSLRGSADRLSSICGKRSCDCRGVCKPKSKYSTVVSTVDAFTMSMSYVIYILHPTLCRSALYLFQCVPLGRNQDGDARYFLYYDLESNCKSTRHLAWVIILGVPAVALYLVLFPIGLGCFLRRQHRKSPATVFSFGLWYSGYSEKRWWWEVIVIYKKILLTLAATFGLFFPNEQIPVTLLLVMGMLAVHLVGSPFTTMQTIEPKSTGVLEGQEGVQRRTLAMYPTPLFREDHEFVDLIREEIMNKASKQEKHTNQRLHRLETTSLVLILLLVWSGTMFTIAPKCMPIPRLGETVITNETIYWCDLIVAILILMNLAYLGYGFFIYFMTFSRKHKKAMKKAREKMQSAKSKRMNSMRSSIMTARKRSKGSLPAASKTPEKKTKKKKQLSTDDKSKSMKSMRKSTNTSSTMKLKGSKSMQSLKSVKSRRSWSESGPPQGPPPAPKTLKIALTTSGGNNTRGERQRSYHETQGQQEVDEISDKIDKVTTLNEWRIRSATD